MIYPPETLIIILRAFRPAFNQQKCLAWEEARPDEMRHIGGKPHFPCAFLRANRISIWGEDSTNNSVNTVFGGSWLFSKRHSVIIRRFLINHRCRGKTTNQTQKMTHFFQNFQIHLSGFTRLCKTFCTRKYKRVEILLSLISQQNEKLILL